MSDNDQSVAAQQESSETKPASISPGDGVETVSSNVFSVRKFGSSEFTTTSFYHDYNQDERQPSIVFTSLPQGGTLTEVIDGQTECILLSPKVKQAILNIPGFPHLVPRPCAHPTPSYRITTIPSKGIGMVATRDIRYGELIAAERALLIFCRYGIYPDLPEDASEEQKQQALRDEFEKYFEVAIERMEADDNTKKSAKAFKSLHNSHLHDGSGPLTGIIRTNSFGIHLPADKYDAHGAVFDTLSRINHSCSPNTIRSWYTPSLSLQLFAARDIKAGEEITAHYVHPLSPLSERQASLAPYGFQCDCPACPNPHAHPGNATTTSTSTSELNRLRISRIQDSVDAIIKWAGNRNRNPRLPDDLLLKPTLDMMKVIEEEGLESVGQYARVLHHLSLIYAGLGDLDESIRYHRRLRMWLRMTGTEEKHMARFLKDVCAVCSAASVCVRMA